MLTSEAQARLDALYRIDQVWIDSLKRQIALLEFEKAKVLHAMFGDGELRIWDKPVHVEVTWPEGRPGGLSDEQILTMFPIPELP